MVLHHYLPRPRTSSTIKTIRCCAFAALCILIVLSVQTVVAADVTGAIKITSPGTYYLRNNITNSPSITCINITSSDVFFDGMGHVIDGVDGFVSYGFYVHGASGNLTNVTVRNVTVRDWNMGILFYGTENSTIEEFTAISSRLYGIELQTTGDTRVRSVAAAESGTRGISLDQSTRARISEAVVSNNPVGLRLSLSHVNWIDGNVIENNAVGLAIVSSSGNTIWNNSFNCSQNVDASVVSVNIWNATPEPGVSIRGGPMLGGNFWNNQTGSGFSATTPDEDGDGFCDSPYVPAAGAVDWLPLAADVGQHQPIFTAETPFRFLRSADGGATAVPTDLYYIYDGSSPDGRPGSPDTMRFAVTMEDAGLLVTANVSEVDGTLDPVEPIAIAGNVYTFAHPVGDASLGNTSSLLRRIPITASIAGFSNTSEAAGTPAYLTAVVNANVTNDWPFLSGTDWNEIDDFTITENLTFRNPGIGSIRFTYPLNLCDGSYARELGNLTGALLIGEGRIAIDTDRPGMIVMDRPAVLVMVLPNASSTPGIFAEGQPAAYANGTIPAGSPVSSVTWDDDHNELSFTVNHWTNFTADYTAPNLSITTPDNGDVIDSTTVTVQGTASDASGIVLVEARVDDGMWTMAEGTDNWSVLLDMPGGSSTISVRATDGIGCTAIATVNVTRPTPPESTPVSSRSGGGVSGGEPVVTEFVGIGRLTVSSFGVLLREATIRSEDSRLVLYLPAGTRIRDAAGGIPDELALRQIQPEDLPDGFEARGIGEAYAFEPKGTTFDPPATVRYSIRSRSVGEIEDNIIRCYISNGSGKQWDELPVQIQGSSAVIIIGNAAEVGFITSSQDPRGSEPADSKHPTHNPTYPAGSPGQPAASGMPLVTAATALAITIAITAPSFQKKR